MTRDVITLDCKIMENMTKYRDCRKHLLIGIHVFLLFTIYYSAVFSVLDSALGPLISIGTRFLPAGDAILRKAVTLIQCRILSKYLITTVR